MFAVLSLALFRRIVGDPRDKGSRIDALFGAAVGPGRPQRHGRSAALRTAATRSSMGPSLTR